MTIQVEDHTRSVTIEGLTEKLEILSQESAKALTALSNNDQIIIAQTKEALEMMIQKILFLGAKLDLFADLMEELVVRKEGETGYIKKLTLDEYREVVNKIKSK